MDPKVFSTEILFAPKLIGPKISIGHKISLDLRFFGPKFFGSIPFGAKI